MKLFKTFPIKENLLGIDIGYDSIKVVELTRRTIPSKLIRFALIENLPPGLLYNQDPQAEEKIVNTIKNGLQKAFPNPIKTKKVVSGLPESKVFTTVISVPKVEKEKGGGRK